MNGPSSGGIDISENGIVVGWTGTEGWAGNNNTRAFVFQNGAPVILGPVPGGLSSIATSLNSSGVVALQGKIQSSPTTLYAAYVYSAGAMSVVPPPRGFDAAAVYQIMANNALVGSCGNVGSNISHPCAWKGTQSVVLDAALIPQSNSILRYAIGASDGGVVLVAGSSPGYGYDLAFLLGPTGSIPGDANCDLHVNIDD